MLNSISFKSIQIILKGFQNFNTGDVFKYVFVWHFTNLDKIFTLICENGSYSHELCMFKDKFQQRKRSLLKTLVNNSRTYSVQQAAFVEHTHWARASVCLSSLNIRVNKQTPGVVAHHFSLHPSGSWANTFDTVQPRVFKRLNTSRAYYIEVRAKIYRLQHDFQKYQIKEPYIIRVAVTPLRKVQLGVL